MNDPLQAYPRAMNTAASIASVKLGEFHRSATPRPSNVRDARAFPIMGTQPLYIQLACWYAPSYGYGGPVRLMADYAQWVTNSGATVKVLTGNIHHDYTRLPPDVSHPLGDSIHRYPVWGTGLAKRSIFILSPKFFLDALITTWKHAGRVYLHLFEFRGLIPLTALLLKRLFPKKVVFVHSAFGTLHYRPSRIRRIYDRFFMRAQMRALDLALVQNGHEMEVYKDLLREYGSSSKVALLPLHYDFVTNEISASNVLNAEKLRWDHGIPPNAVILLFLGRFHPEKGLVRTIDLLCCLRSRGVDAMLLLVGRDHGFQREIESYISTSGMTPYVRIITNIFEQRFNYYSLADIFIGLPTISEETMLASVEALSCGTPVLLSKEADMPYVVENNAGFVIDYELNTAADRCMSIINELPSFRANASKVAMTYYSPDAMRRQFLCALGSVR